MTEGPVSLGEPWKSSGYAANLLDIISYARQTLPFSIFFLSKGDDGSVVKLTIFPTVCSTTKNKVKNNNNTSLKTLK